MTNKTGGVLIMFVGVVLLTVVGWLDSNSRKAAPAPNPPAISSFEICVEGKQHLVIPSVNYLEEIEGAECGQ